METGFLMRDSRIPSNEKIFLVHSIHSDFVEIEKEKKANAFKSHTM